MARDGRQTLEAFLKSHIRNIPDFPKPGIIFRDITTLMLNPQGLATMVSALSAAHKDMKIDVVAGIEARGFILGGAIAQKLGTGFVPIRKPGKLPAATYRESYDLEYGTDALEVHQDALHHTARVLIVDDLIATGGTAEAAINLIRRAGADPVAAGFVIDLPDLGGRARIEALGCPTTALCAFEGE